MAIKKAQFIIRGMNRDMASSKFNPEFAYENKNLRIAATEDNDTLSLVNEKGTLPKSISWDTMGGSLPAYVEGDYVLGTPIGQEVIDDELVLFTTDAGTDGITIIGEENDNITIVGTEATVDDLNVGTNDHIYKFWFEGDILRGRKLFSGNLGFSAYHPIECVSIYENENLKKVYWTDGINQPRVINISASAPKILSWNQNSFDFIRRMSLKEHVYIVKDKTGGGVFAPGVLQYCFTYFDMYGQESNIFYTSPQYYTSYLDRGAKPGDSVSNSFSITLTNLDTNFDYVRIYSILRTSLDATPQARKVADLSISSTGGAFYRDNGVAGETIDPTDLFYVGGESILAGTMSQKDNTLFLGDLKKTTISLNSLIQNTLAGSTITFAVDTTKVLDTKRPSGYYTFESQLDKNSNQIKTFKYKEWYRFGIQAQHYTGKWSDVIFLNDVQNDKSITGIDWGEYELPYAKFTLSDDSVLRTLVSQGFIRIRPVVVYPTIADRECLCQGVLCPTVYNAEDRLNNAPFAQSSWFFRPNAPFDTLYDPNNYLTYDYNGSSNPSNRAFRNFTKDIIPSASLDIMDLDGAGIVTTNSRSAIMSNYAFVTDYGTDHSIAFSTSKMGSWTEFRHNAPIPGNNLRNAEIQCISEPATPYLGATTSDMFKSSTYVESSDKQTWVSQNKECFYVDQSIITMHSPEIEFNSEFKTLDLSGAKLRIIGRIDLTASVSDINIETSTPPLAKNEDLMKSSTGQFMTAKIGAYKETIGAENISKHGFKSLLTAAMWMDGRVGSVSSQTEDNVLLAYGYAVYPWHRSGPLNNQRELRENESEKSALLKHKVMSTLRYSGRTVYYDTEWDAYVENSSTKTGISGAVLFEDDEMSLIKLPAPENSGSDDINYYGNIDKLITYHRSGKGLTFDFDTDKITTASSAIYSPISSADQSITAAPAYPIAMARGYWSDQYMDASALFKGRLEPMSKITLEGSNYALSRYGWTTIGMSNDPVLMKYKSSPHVVMALNYTTDHKQRVLPTHLDGAAVVNNRASVEVNGNLVWNIKDQETVSLHHLFWNDTVTGVSQDVYGSDIRFGYLWLGELYRDNITNRFGGTTQEAFENNKWEPCGDPISIVDVDGVALNSVVIKWTEGDTFYQRYDCLKTYPFTSEDQNSIVDILSFMCETRVNIDGRYDRNRGLTNNLAITPTNFNLLNTAYSQRDNFYTYRSINSNKLDINSFPNTITWTKTKTLGETVDTWANVTLASTLDLDGNKGSVRALRRLNDSLISFQDTGISQILYNENVQIASTAGVPIEIANSGKVAGKRYISNTIGCTNKWSIGTTPSGLYFVDSRDKGIYLFNGQLTGLSNSKGFHSWTVTTFDGVTIWNPADFDECVTYYDKINGDVYFITRDNCLAFSEQLGNFSSFYSYESTPYMGTIKDRSILWHPYYTGGYYKPWLYREGDYNMFYGTYQPFWTTVVVNPSPTEDKIFNNVEFRSDSFNDGVINNTFTFDTLTTWNEYQHGVATLSNTVDKPSTLKKKFRVWRANIPRWNTIKNGLSPNMRDRMRNPWLYLKLSMEQANTYKTVLHDVVVDYFE